MTTDQLTPEQKAVSGLVPGVVRQPRLGLRRGRRHAPDRTEPNRSVNTAGTAGWAPCWRVDPREEMITILMTQKRLDLARIAPDVCSRFLDVGVLRRSTTDEATMATYVLIHGAGSDSWYWHLVVPELQARGHDVVTMDLPCDDDTAGLAEYTDTVVDAIGDRTDLVLVAQSMAGFTAPLVCERVPVDKMVLVAAMVPVPGEYPGDWWANTGWEEARRRAGPHATAVRPTAPSTRSKRSSTTSRPT